MLWLKVVPKFHYRHDKEIHTYVALTFATPALPVVTECDHLEEVITFQVRQFSVRPHRERC